MSAKTIYSQVRAVYQEGVLSLLDPLELPEGAQVRLDIQVASNDSVDEATASDGVYPTRSVPAERLARLIGVLSVGGDAVADSEQLYEIDRCRVTQLRAEVTTSA